MKWCAAGLVLLVAACGSGNSLNVTSAYATEPSGPNAAVYLDITNKGGTPDRLVDVAIDGFTTMLHETSISADGQATMSQVMGIDISEKSSVALRPGGIHIMIMDAAGLVDGDELSATFTFEKHPPVTEMIPVVTLDAYLELIESQQ
ncbi:MAG: copper chaperone PCu(A)C [Acidimicrobiia bacterium]|nr:copper chaperone PCu(A)C [Acidimicrobiia bacterium]NNL28642.1 copper chaperone PCu(A)C [Acidimicrobiia bacterium]